MKATYNTIDWEQRRYELAKSAMNGILSDENEVGYACSEVKYGENEKIRLQRLSLNMRLLVQTH